MNYFNTLIESLKKKFLRSAAKHVYCAWYKRRLLTHVTHHFLTCLILHSFPKPPFTFRMKLAHLLMISETFLVKIKLRRCLLFSSFMVLSPDFGIKTNKRATYTQQKMSRTISIKVLTAFISTGRVMPDFYTFLLWKDRVCFIFLISLDFLIFS